MNRVKQAVKGLIFPMCIVLGAWPGAGAVLQESDQELEPGPSRMEFAWDATEGADSYDGILLRNDTVVDAASAIQGTTLAFSGDYTPGYYTFFVRGVSGKEKGAWSDPLTVKVKRAMTPGASTVFLKAPALFTWTRSPTASRYLLKLYKFDPKTGKYAVKQTVWISQPGSGSPQWLPPVASIPKGKYRWTVADYAGATPGYTSTAYFQVNPVAGMDYLVVDLSGGTNVNRFTVTHLADVPAGGWTDAYKTTKLVLRKVAPGTFTMGSPDDELGRTKYETLHEVTLTKAFYIGVFEVTQKQWELVMGNRPSWFVNAAAYPSRPVETVSYNDIRGMTNGAAWPATNTVDASSFMGVLRKKTKLAGFDLPTEAQWEYACRAGTTTALNSGTNLTTLTNCPSLNKLGRTWTNGGKNNAKYIGTEGATAKAGSYIPNMWGLYDMHGNVWEWCLDWYADSYPVELADPSGSPVGPYRVNRGGGWVGSNMGYYRSADRTYRYPASGKESHLGFRAVMTP